MTKLKDTYPLYLANEAKQPNADLEVTDNIPARSPSAARWPMRRRSTPDRRAVEAAEPMARLASYERQAVLQHCVDRFKERFDELAFALCVEAGKPIQR
jgi:acyl-CoA reductase-like NAD-dependent aldehyde dehydrogenase